MRTEMILSSFRWIFSFYQLLFASASQIFFLILSGCAKISDSLIKLNGTTHFLWTKIIVGGPQPAKRVSQLLTGLRLKNSDNKTASHFKLIYEVIARPGVTGSACIKGDSDGIFAGLSKSVFPEQKTLELTNTKVEMRENILFENPAGALAHILSRAQRFLILPLRNQK